MLDPTIRDLVFELTDTDEPKVCIAVCDDVAHGWRIREVIVEELTKAGILTIRIQLTPRDVDLTELIRERSGNKDRRICLLEGFEYMGTKPLHQVLRGLNFRRDVLFSLSIPLLFWVSTRVLSVMVEKAPDFWSRRTTTYYFTRPSVREILTRLFGEREVDEVRPDRVGDAFRKVLSAEREFKRVLQVVRRGGDGPLGRWLDEIENGVKGLIEECNRGRRFQVVFWLWTETEMDEALRKAVSAIPVETRSYFTDLYEDRNGILLDLSEAVTGLLERYLGRVKSAADRRSSVSLLSMFMSDATRRVQAWGARVAKALDRWAPLPRDGSVSGEASDDEMGWQRPRVERHVRRREHVQEAMDLEERLRAVAAERLRGWLEGDTDALPRVFTREEGEVLKLMYQRPGDLSILTRRLGRPADEVLDVVERLKGKVHAFLGVHILAIKAPQ